MTPAVQAVAQPDPIWRPAGPTVQQAEIQAEVALVSGAAAAGKRPRCREPEPGAPLVDRLSDRQRNHNRLQAGLRALVE
jgi:hypothetical protein